MQLGQLRYKHLATCGSGYDYMIKMKSLGGSRFRLPAGPGFLIAEHKLDHRRTSIICVQVDWYFQGS